MGEIRSTRTTRALLLTLASWAVVGCGGGGDEASDDPGPATVLSRDLTSTTTAPVAETTGSAPPSTAGDGTNPPQGCTAAGTVTGDVDGDDQPDRVLHHLTEDGPRLDVCTWWFSGSVPGVGQGSFVDLVDVNGDEAMDILFGSVENDVVTVQVAQADTDGNLVVVTGADGEPLTLTDGYPDGPPPEGRLHTYGCVPAAGEAPAQLVAVRVTANGEVSYELTPYTVDFGSATAGEVVAQAVTGLPAGDAEEQAEAAARQVAPLCSL
jgi:hypothetical protein